MSDLAIWPGELELRQDGRTLTGSFPYMASATLRDRGVVRKERFRPGAFSFTLQGFRDPPSGAAPPAQPPEVNLLSGHDFGKPLASRRAGSLKLRDSERALVFEARLPPVTEWPTWMRDAVDAVRAGLFQGVSPGFRLPPPDVVAVAERLVDEVGTGIKIREILAAILFELSLVTRPAYSESSVDVRADQGLLEGGNRIVCPRGPREITAAERRFPWL